MSVLFTRIQKRWSISFELHLSMCRNQLFIWHILVGSLCLVLVWLRLGTFVCMAHLCDKVWKVPASHALALKQYDYLCNFSSFFIKKHLFSVHGLWELMNTISLCVVLSFNYFHLTFYSYSFFAGLERCGSKPDMWHSTSAREQREESIQ